MGQRGLVRKDSNIYPVCKSANGMIIGLQLPSFTSVYSKYIYNYLYNYLYNYVYYIYNYIYIINFYSYI